jgi:IS30 family transposase
MTGKSLSTEEVRLAKTWAVQENLPPSEIASRLGRNKSTITRLLKPRSTRTKRGRKVVP